MGVRVARTHEDFEIFRALADEYEESLPPDLRHRAWPVERNDAERAYRPPHAVLLARIGARDVGCVVLFQRDAASVIVKKLYVAPTARAGGAGRALMQRLIDEARARGCASVLLDTDAQRLPGAYRLYRSLGFQERDAYEPVDYRNATFMQLDLS